jgi:hypothetical protein
MLFSDTIYKNGREGRRGAFSNFQMREGRFQFKMRRREELQTITVAKGAIPQNAVLVYFLL